MKKNIFVYYFHHKKNLFILIFVSIVLFFLMCSVSAHADDNEDYVEKSMSAICNVVDGNEYVELSTNASVKYRKGNDTFIGTCLITPYWMYKNNLCHQVFVGCFVITNSPLEDVPYNFTSYGDYNGHYIYISNGDFHPLNQTGELNINSCTAKYYYSPDNTVSKNIYDHFVDFCKQFIDSNFSGYDNPYLSRQTLYDLEIPLNVKVKQKSLLDLGFIELGKDDPLYLTWEQDDPNHTYWSTEIFVSCKGSIKKHWYSVNKKDFDVDWYHYTDVDCYKLKYKYDVSKDNLLDSYIKDQVGDFYSASCKPSLMIRNSYYDESTNTQHYSNYVYMDNSTKSESGADSEYSGFEVDGEKFDSDNESTIKDNIKGDSDYYDGSSVVGADSTTSGALGVLKGVWNDVKMFPDFFGQVLDFLPDQLITIFYSSLVVCIGIAVLKIVL